MNKLTIYGELDKKRMDLFIKSIRNNADNIQEEIRKQTYYYQVNKVYPVIDIYPDGREVISGYVSLLVEDD